MEKIYKYEIAESHWHKVQMPLGSEILSAQLQDSKVCLWAKVNTNNVMTERVFGIFLTGESLESMYDMKFIATIQRGQFVLHLFEIMF